MVRAAPINNTTILAATLVSTTAGMPCRRLSNAVMYRSLRNYEPAPVEVCPIATQPFSEAHFATFPPELAERCIKAGCPAGGVVLDPFGGAGTVSIVADRLQRDAVLIELNASYIDIARRRITGDAPLLNPLEAA